MLFLRAGGSWHSSYSPVPHYITSEMKSLFLEGYEYSVFDLREKDRVQIQVQVKPGNCLILQFSSFASSHRFLETKWREEYCMVNRLWI